MSSYKEKIEKGKIKMLFSPRRSGVHKWMKRQMNKFIRRQSIEDDDIGYKSNRKPFRGWEY
jgi:hypothetical protein